jgi:hypothetical protein
MLTTQLEAEKLALGEIVQELGQSEANYDKLEMEFKSCKNEYKNNIEELQLEISESIDRNGIVTQEFETAKAEYDQKILDLNAKVSAN